MNCAIASFPVFHSTHDSTFITSARTESLRCYCFESTALSLMYLSHHIWHER